MTSSLLVNEITLLVIVLGVLVVVRFEMHCLSDLARTPDYRLRILTRQGWLICILFCIPLGGVFYLQYGRDE